MSNDLRLFANGEFEIQVTPEADTFTVLAAGVARSLGFRDAFRLVEHIPADEKGYTLAGTPGGQQVWYLTEAGFYRAIGQRQAARVKDAAVRESVERFQKWVYADVLPAIRRAGVYGVPSAARPDLSTPAGVLALAEAYVASARELVAANEQLAIAAPKAAQADYHRAADGLIPVGDFANKVKAWAKDNHGVRVKHDEVWDFLGQIGLIIRGNTRRNNQPTAFAIERDFVRAKETEYETRHGEVHVSTSPRLTPAGEGWAWDRAVARITGHGSLRPMTTIERKAS